MDAPASQTSAAPQIARVVLDTNAVLDWLIFRNPASIPFGNAIFKGSVRWLTSTNLRAELSHVLARGVVNEWATDFTFLWDTWNTHAIELLDPPEHHGHARLRCTDSDDQKFIDFAVAHRAQWLLTRDRAVLKLRKKALLFGLVIATPEAWSPLP
jgi:predicted nucleic acid-binding protein